MCGDDSTNPRTRRLPSTPCPSTGSGPGPTGPRARAPVRADDDRLGDQEPSRRPCTRRPRSARGAGEVAEQFPGRTLVVPTGNPKVRANDTDYRFRPGTDFFYLTGCVEPDAVLVITPGSVARAHALRPPTTRPVDARVLHRRALRRAVGRAAPRRHRGRRLLRDRHRTARATSRRTSASLAPTRSRCADSTPASTRRSGPNDATSDLARAQRAASGEGRVRGRRSSSSPIDHTVKGFEGRGARAARRRGSRRARHRRRLQPARARRRQRRRLRHDRRERLERDASCTGRATTERCAAATCCCSTRASSATTSTPPTSRAHADQRHVLARPARASTSWCSPPSRRASTRCSPGAEFKAPHEAAMKVLAEGLVRAGHLAR